MATAKTGSFYLTETVQIPLGSANGTRVMETVDLSAYINVPTGQAIAIESVDFIYQQGTDYGQSVNSYLAGNGAISAQLTDQNPGTLFVRADDFSLIASGGMVIDATNNVASSSVDLYPDNFGPTALSEAFLVVNDTLYLTAGNDGAAIGPSWSIFVTARIKARVVKLSQKDWVSLALQSTASDN